MVAFLYGTLNASLRRVYTLTNPPSAPALSAARGWLAALCFVHLPFQRRRKGRTVREKSTGPSDLAPPKPTPRLLWLTALDLAIWNVMAQGLINVGLLFCSSARASFLVQSSVIFTPFLSLAAGHIVPRALWLGVGLAFAGLTIVSGGEIASATDTSTLLNPSNFSIRPGDAIVLAGALSWSMYLLRLSRASSPERNKHGIEFPALSLQAIKTLLVAVMYTCWWVAKTCFNPPSPHDTATMLWWNSGLAWFWLAISAIGPGAVADVLQQRGQKHVSAAEANIILSSEPIFTAICGFVLLGETVARREMVGGAVIVVAALLSSLYA
ncbi:EamA-like transporter family [Seminavis robusta]|uniref:EamA-like transporter family n=1 Tax=Seminavis robusta TaxID=568900 RepID=A0A9N8HVS9_9STRA|nr:EamA-like transporter family [Seminavis robusta]|eukprot:Sro2407_g326600.1 EamA-like transporter family (325) ;mRNA; r:13269-14243